MPGSEERPYVSVVIATRDRARLLSAAVGSCLEQDYPADRFEVVVVDDGSSDDTPSVLSRLSRRTEPPKLHALRQAPTNANSARNRGFERGEGVR